MNVEESLRRFGLVPSDESLPHIRALLAQEAEAERSDGQPEDDLALLCCVQLFSRGLLENVLRIWDAKQSGFDLSCYLDGEFLCGAGLAETKRFLAAEPGSAASEALEYLTGCEQAGTFAEFSPASHLERYRRYFGVEESAHPEDTEERREGRPEMHRSSSNRVTAQLRKSDGLWRKRLPGCLLLLSALLVPSWLVVHLVAWTFGASPAPWEVKAPSWGRAAGSIVLGLSITVGAILVCVRHMCRNLQRSPRL